MAASTDLLHGTPHPLMLQTAVLEPGHGEGVPQHLQQVSNDPPQNGQGSLYPALYRLEYKGWIRWEWGNHRAPNVYCLTPAVRKECEREREFWNRLSATIALARGPSAEACG